MQGKSLLHYNHLCFFLIFNRFIFQVDREILCLKIATYKHNQVLIVSVKIFFFSKFELFVVSNIIIFFLQAKHKDPFVYNLNTDEIVLSLVSNTSNLSISCISVFGNSIFCCDASKKVFTFDWTNDKPLQQVDSSKSLSLIYHVSYLVCVNYFLFFSIILCSWIFSLARALFVAGLY